MSKTDNYQNMRFSPISLFSKITLENAEKLHDFELQLQDIRGKINLEKSDIERLALEHVAMQVEDDVDKCAVTVIIFAIITLEAYIYDYSARYLSDSYARNYLDKLDIFSKWIVIPRLICGKEISGESKWHQQFKALIRQRNAIIHSKSSSFPTEADGRITFIKRQHDHSKQIVELAHQAVRLFETIATEIANIHPVEAPWVRIYLLQHKSEEE